MQLVWYGYGDVSQNGNDNSRSRIRWLCVYNNHTHTEEGILGPPCLIHKAPIGEFNCAVICEMTEKAN